MQLFICLTAALAPLEDVDGLLPLANEEGMEPDALVGLGCGLWVWPWVDGQQTTEPRNMHSVGVAVNIVICKSISHTDSTR